MQTTVDNSEFVKRLHALVMEMVQEHPTDITAATTAVLDMLQNDIDYGDYVSTLVFRAVREMCHQARHNIAKEQRKQNGTHVTNQRVSMFSESVNRAYQEFGYNYPIGGTILGELRGEAIPTLLDGWKQGVQTGQFHIKLGEWLIAQGVRNNVRVRDVVPEKKLQAFKKKVMKELS